MRELAVALGGVAKHAQVTLMREAVAIVMVEPPRCRRHGRKRRLRRLFEVEQDEFQLRRMGDGGGPQVRLEGGLVG